MFPLCLFTFVVLSGTAKIAFIHHANQSFSDNGQYALLPGDPGYVGNSYHRTLDTHFYWGVPIDIHISGPLIHSYGWLQNDNGLLNRLKSDLVDIVGGVYAENILPYVDSSINIQSLMYAKQVDSAWIKPPGRADYPTVIWIPERVWKSENLMSYSLIAILNTVYGKYGHTSWGQTVWIPPVIVLDDNVHSWYYHTFADGTECTNPFKVHQMVDSHGNRVFVVFISSTARTQMVWNNVSDPGNSLHQLLWSLSQDWDQSQIVLYGDDWEKAAGVAGWDFGQAGAPANSYDANISWIKSQSWIQPIHIGEAAKWWGVDYLYDSDPWNDPPIIQIDYAAYPELHSWTGGTYDNWYYDFQNTQAYECGLGPDLNLNSVRGDYEDLWKWAKLQLINRTLNPVSNLGWVTLSGMLYETAWHTGPGGSLIYWGKNLWNHTRYSGGYAFGSLWLDSLRFLPGSHVTPVDMDADSFPEYAIWNDKICAIFDRRGGRALWVFTKDSSTVVGNLMSNWGTEGDWDDGGHTGLFHDTEAWNSWFNVYIDTTSSDTAKLILVEAYDSNGTPNSNLTKTITLVHGFPYLEVLYNTTGYNWTKSGLSPDLNDVLLNKGLPVFVSGLSDSGWAYAGFRGPDSTYAVYLWGEGQNLTFHYLGKMSSGADLVELGGRNGLWHIYFYAGKNKPEVFKQGPGDQEGPTIWSVNQAPESNILETDSVKITVHADDPSGVSTVQLHYGLNGNWGNPDIPMYLDDGSQYDWDNDGQPDPDLYGVWFPPQPYGTLVEYAIYAEDSLGHGSWESNYGQNYSYTVGYIVFNMDGQLDRVAQLVSENEGMHLWAYYYADSGKLYVATESAGNGDGYFSNDHFILIKFGYPSPTVPAPWAKSGYVGSWDYFLADEHDNDFQGWFDSSQNLMSDTSVFKSASGPSGQYLEGVIDIESAIGYVPDSIFIAVGSYETWDGGTLQWQVPRPDTMDGNIDPTEFLAFRAMSGFVLDGYLDSNALLIDSVLGYHLYYSVSTDSTLLYVATEAAGLSGTEDKYIFVSFKFPYDSVNVPDGKSGFVGKYSLYLKNEGVTNHASWFDSTGVEIFDTSVVRSYAPDSGWTEGVINLPNLLGFTPGGIYISLGTYEHITGGNLLVQIPLTVDSDGNIDGYEFFNHRISLVNGDVDGDGVVNYYDVLYLAGYLFYGYPEPSPPLIADQNGDFILDPMDIVYLSNQIFQSRVVLRKSGFRIHLGKEFFKLTKKRSAR